MIHQRYLLRRHAFYGFWRFATVARCLWVDQPHHFRIPASMYVPAHESMKQNIATTRNLAFARAYKLGHLLRRPRLATICRYCQIQTPHGQTDRPSEPLTTQVGQSLLRNLTAALDTAECMLLMGW